MVFPGDQKTTWTYDARRGAWYYHRFYDFQPDLNMANPRVREEIEKIIGFWLQLGVAGFRIDAAPFVIEKPAPDGEPHDALRPACTSSASSCSGGAATPSCSPRRTWSPRDDAAVLRRGGDGLHMLFNFLLNQHLFSRSPGDARPLAQALRATRERSPRDGQWANFLRNHDELDLGRLTPTSAQRVFAAFGPEPTCSSTTAASAGGWRRCSATAAGSSWPTACSSRCPARR